MIVLREMAPAKINLYLHIIGKRPDGYHLLDSLVAFAEAGDKLEVVPSADLTLTITGTYAHQLSAQNNSVLKAAEALRKKANITAGAALTLHKELPVAAGLGGGSADAAAALRLLMRFWSIKLSQNDIMSIALSLGADVPACLHSASLYMGGIGEIIEEGPVLAGIHIVLVNPGKPLATPQVFAGYSKHFSLPARHPGAFASHQACTEFLHKNRNDLQEPAVKLMPEIGIIIAAINSQKDCMLARMSGSGATCFGLFSNAQSAQKAAEALSELWPSGWVKQTMIR